MDTQVKQLKLNVTNIKSYLISSNKELRKLKVQKKELFFKIEKQREIRAEESRVENKNLGIGAGFSRLMSVVTTPVRSIFDRILDFFGLIALGILVQKLPEIIAKIEEFFNSDFIKSVGKILTTVGTGFQKLGELLGILPKQKQDEIDKDLKSIERESDDGLKMADQSDREVSLLERLLGKSEQKQPEPAGGGMGGARGSGSSPGSIQPSPTPSVQPIQAPAPITPAPQPVQAFSSGGTVQPNKSQQTKAPYQPRKSGQLKRAERGMGNGFEDFSLAVENINQTVQRDEKNVMAFAELSKNFREYVSLFDKRKGDGKSSGAPGPGDDPNAPLPGDDKVFDYESPTGDATITFYGGQGRDASGEPGLDFSFKDYKNNYSLFAGEVVGTPVYDGYGQSLRIRSKDPATGKIFDALYAHFPPGGVKVKVGDKVTPGQFLGPVGWDHRNNRPIRGAGNMTGPHTSVDFFEPGTLTPYSNAGGVTTSVIQRKGKKPKGTPETTIKPAQVVQPPKGTRLESVSQDPVADAIRGLSGVLQRPGGGGGRKLLNNTSSSGNRSLFIYAVQPVETFVPFPYPVPMQQTSSSPPQRQKLSEIWRA